jgi:prevent-host-death family protein
MKTAAVSKLKASLSEYLRSVKAGDEVLVTERGVAIAKLVPVGEHDLSEDEALAALERDGLLRRGSGRIPDELWDRPRTAGSDGRLLEALLEERREGR